MTGDEKNIHIPADRVLVPSQCARDLGDTHAMGRSPENSSDADKFLGISFHYQEISLLHKIMLVVRNKQMIPTIVSNNGNQ
jgi:hypothetical protein